MQAPTQQRKPIHYVIIGNSAAGISAATEIRRYDPRGEITMISDETTFGYSRVLLPLYIAGKITKKMMLIAPRDFYSSLRIRLLRGETAESIDSKNQRVGLRSGKTLTYDRLLVATGSSPRELSVPGKDLRGIFYLRKLTDAEEIKAGLAFDRGPILVVGGGLVGLKSLEALVAKRRKVHLVISSSRILSQMVDPTASDFFLAAFRKKGVDVHLNADVRAFHGRQHLESALLSDGTALACSLAIIGKGVDPNTGPLKETGVALYPGVIVDAHMATQISSIYAAGDVAEVFDLLRGEHLGNAIWPLAVEGGRIAGANMAGVLSTLPGGLRMNSLDVLGVRVISAGEWGGGEGFQLLNPERSIYRKLVFSGKRLKGFILAGDIRCAGILTSLVKNQMEVSPVALEEGLERGFSYSPRLQVLGGSIQSLETGRR